MRITSTEIPNTTPCVCGVGYVEKFILRICMAFCLLFICTSQFLGILQYWTPVVSDSRNFSRRAIGIFAAAVWICVDLLAFNPPVTLVYSALETRGLCRDMYIAQSEKSCKEFYRVFV